MALSRLIAPLLSSLSFFTPISCPCHLLHFNPLHRRSSCLEAHFTQITKVVFAELIWFKDLAIKSYQSIICSAQAPSDSVFIIKTICSVKLIVMIRCHLSWASPMSWTCKGLKQLMKFTEAIVRPKHWLGHSRQNQRAKRARGRKAGWEEVLNQNRSCDRTESKKELRPPSEAVPHTSQASRGHSSVFVVIEWEAEQLPGGFAGQLKSTLTVHLHREDS